MRHSKIIKQNNLLENETPVSSKTAYCVARLLDDGEFTGRFSKKAAVAQVVKELLLYNIDERNNGSEFNSRQTRNYVIIRLKQLKQLR